MKSDGDFIQSLKESQKFVSLVASWMKRHGCDVMIRPTEVRPDFDSRNDYTDSGDIEIRQRVEVKQRSIAFTSSSDYPFNTVIVDEEFKIDRIPKSTLWGYIIVNKDSTYACCIKSDTRASWDVERKYDSKDGQHRSFYVCPKELCSFCKIDQ